MSERVTFIHAGDIHLGAPFRGLRALSPAWADRLAGAIPDAYDKVIQACIDEHADFLLLAGDVFDTDKPSYAHYRRFLAGLRRLASRGIPAYIIAGNHDPYANWHDIMPDLPEGAVLFPSDAPSFALFEKNGAPVAAMLGMFAYTRNLVKDARYFSARSAHQRARAKAEGRDK